MNALAVKVRQWGDSLGVVIPKDVAREEKLVEGDTVLLSVQKEADLGRFFGTCTHKEESTQQLKDELRKIWSR